MSITGYYDGTAVRMEESLRINQKVIVIPIEDEIEFGESVAGALRKYANQELIEQEKDAWRKAAVKNMVENRCLLDANAILRFLLRLL